MGFFRLSHIPPFLITPPPPPSLRQKKKSYTRKQPTHFSMTPSSPKCFFKNQPITQSGIPKKMAPKSQAKFISSFPQYPFLTIFNPKKVSCEQIYNFKS